MEIAMTDPASRIIQPPPLAAIILCGGNSKRMGSPKATLPFGSETMLQRVVSQLDKGAPPPDPIVIVGAAAQELPPIRRQHGVVIFATDQQPDRGPLEGLLTGLRHLADQPSRQAPQWAFATGCDTPLLCPAWPQALVAKASPSVKAIVPVDQTRRYPLAAAYHVELVPELEQFQAQGGMRIQALCDLASTLRVPVDDLRCVDPRLDTLTNLNTIAEYHAALQRCGFESQLEA